MAKNYYMKMIGEHGRDQPVVYVAGGGRQYDDQQDSSFADRSDQPSTAANHELAHGSDMEAHLACPASIIDVYLLCIYLNVHRPSACSRFVDLTIIEAHVGRSINNRSRAVMSICIYIYIYIYICVCVCVCVCT